MTGDLSDRTGRGVNNPDYAQGQRAMVDEVSPGAI